MKIITEDDNNPAEKKKGDLEDQVVPSCAQRLSMWRGTSIQAEGSLFISHAAECVNSSLVLNKIRPCFLPIIRSMYFLTDFHTAALLL